MANPEPMDSVEDAFNDTVERILNSVRLRRVAATEAEMATADEEALSRLVMEKHRLLTGTEVRNPDWRMAVGRAKRESRHPERSRRSPSPR